MARIPPDASAPKFGRRAMDKSQPVSSWLFFQFRRIHRGYPHWENLILLAIFVFAMVMALSYAEENSVRLHIRDWIQATYRGLVAP